MRVVMRAERGWRGRRGLSPANCLSGSSDLGREKGRGRTCVQFLSEGEPEVHDVFLFCGCEEYADGVGRGFEVGGVVVWRRVGPGVGWCDDLL